MDIRIVETPLARLVVIEPEVRPDERGFFLESYHRQRYHDHGILYEFVQDNHSRSARGVLRGFHYQDMRAPTAKLVRCTFGAILDVAVDLRVGSPTFGQTYAVELTAANKRQLMVPPEFGHAFLTLSEAAEVQYKASGYYTPSAEGGVAWNDPEIGFAWPTDEPILSPRDQRQPSLADYRQNPAFVHG